jgi:two-component system sensor histidine kinase BaeS
MSPRHHWRRPPWWPEDEAWPPERRSRAWQNMRGRLLWPFAIFFCLLVMFAATAVNLLLWLLAGLFGPIESPLGFVGMRPVAILFVIGLGILFILNGIRRVTSPLGDMLEAIGRIAEGDYTARMSERGTRGRRELAHAVNRMAARLQSSDEQRRNWMADMAHELRTPLTLIQGNLEGVLDGVYPRDDAHLRLVLEETQWLSRLIDDLRTLALSESGALQLHTEPTDLGALVRDVALAMQPQADAAGIRLDEEIPADLAHVQADPARIREVLMNLAANALRYTPAGKSPSSSATANAAPLEVRAEGIHSLASAALLRPENPLQSAKGPAPFGRSQDGVLLPANREPAGGVVTFRLTHDAAHKAVVVEVMDNGTGISQADLPHIFDRFYKSPESRGSGLGLAIARSLVVAHGGEISANSVPGKGTTIRFTLPAAQGL